MTIDAQQLPVAAVFRVVVVIVIAMVDRELAQIAAVELARATAADPRIHGQRAVAITLAALVGIAPRVGNDLVVIAFDFFIKSAFS